MKAFTDLFPTAEVRAWGFGTTVGVVSNPLFFQAQSQGTHLSKAAKALKKVLRVQAPAGPRTSGTRSGREEDVVVSDNSRRLVVFVTDAEEMKDIKQARSMLAEPSLLKQFANQRILLLGMGAKHSIHDIMALFPVTTALQTLYCQIADEFLQPVLPSPVAMAELQATAQSLTSTSARLDPYGVGKTAAGGAAGRPTGDVSAAVLSAASTMMYTTQCYQDTLREVLDTTRVVVGDSVVFVPRTQDFLVPDIPGVLDAVTVDGVPASALQVVPFPGSLAAAARVQTNSAVTAIVRLYNAAFASIRVLGVDFHDPAVDSVLSACRALATEELRSLQDLLGSAAGPWGAATRAAQLFALMRSAAAGDGPRPGKEEKRELAKLIRTPEAEAGDAANDELQGLLRAVAELVQQPPSVEAATLARELMNSTTRGNLSNAAVSRLLARAEKRVRPEAWNKVEAWLAAWDPDAAAAAAAGASPPRWHAQPFAPGLPLERVVMALRHAAQRHASLDVTECCISGEPGPVLAVVGNVYRRPLVAGEDPLLTVPDGPVDGTAYSLLALHHLLPEGAKHTFRSSCGPVNAVVGLLPGCADLCFRAPGARDVPEVAGVVVSELTKGSWLSPQLGFREVWSLLAGVVALGPVGREGARTAFARTLALGWAELAACLSVRRLLPNGQKDDACALQPCLLVAMDMLAAACADPQAWVGKQVADKAWWEALLFVRTVLLEELVRVDDTDPLQAWLTRVADGIAPQARDAFLFALEVAQVVRAASAFIMRPGSSDAIAAPAASAPAASVAAHEAAVDQFRATLYHLLCLPAGAWSLSALGTSAVEDAGGGARRKPRPSFVPWARHVLAAAPCERSHDLIALLKAATFDTAVPAETELLEALGVPSASTAPWARAVFWAAVADRGRVCAHTFEVASRPDSLWEELRHAAQARGVAMEKDLLAGVRDMCATAFGRVASRATLPVVIGSGPKFGPTIPVVRCDGSHFEAKLLSSRLPVNLCSAADSVLFLQGAASLWRDQTFGKTRSCFLPRFHSTLSAWASDPDMVIDPQGFVAAAVTKGMRNSAWTATGVTPTQLTSWIANWWFQRRVMMAAETSPEALPEDLCRRLGVPEAELWVAAQWGPEDAERVRAMFSDTDPDKRQWSWHMATACVALHVSRVLNGIEPALDAGRLRRTLTPHRACVVPKAEYLQEVRNLAGVGSGAGAPAGAGVGVGPAPSTTTAEDLQHSALALYETFADEYVFLRS
jgi:hypothetical protein